MDYLIEARKFIQRARQADLPEVTKTDLEMAEWLLSREIEVVAGSSPRHLQLVEVASLS